MAGSSAVTSKEILDAQTHLWSQLFGFMNSFSLKVAVELGIADAIHNHGKPIALAELASALSIPASRTPYLQRLMRLLVHNNFFAEPEPSVYALTPNSTVLVAEMGASIAPFIELVMHNSIIVPWTSVSEWLKNENAPSTPFEMFHGVYIWEATGRMPDLGKAMLEGLDSDSVTVAKVIIEDCRDQFEGVKTLVEVAGGKGKIAKAIKEAFPGIECKVLDLPHVVVKVEKSGDVEYVAGDMFESIPSADALILKWVLMTWNDEECVKILKNCKAAIPTKENGGKVIIMEKVLDISPDGVHPKHTEAQIYYDLQMMVHVTGRLRTENEWKKIFAEAGFKAYNIIPALGSRCIIELYH